MAKEHVPFGFTALFEQMREAKALRESEDVLNDIATGTLEGCSVLSDNINISDIEDSDFDPDDLDDSDDIIPDDLKELDAVLDKAVDDEDADEEKTLQSLEECLDCGIL